jgi:hypothetical protein
MPEIKKVNEHAEIKAMSRLSDNSIKKHDSDN